MVFASRLDGQGPFAARRDGFALRSNELALAALGLALALFAPLPPYSVRNPPTPLTLCLSSHYGARALS